MGDKLKRATFYRLLHNLQQARAFFKSDEAIFHMSGEVNCQNCSSVKTRKYTQVLSPKKEHCGHVQPLLPLRTPTMIHYDYLQLYIIVTCTENLLDLHSSHSYPQPQRNTTNLAHSMLR